MIDQLAGLLGINGTSATEILISGGVAVFIAVVLVWQVIPHLRRRLADWRIRRRIAKMGQKLISGMRIPDGVDGELHIDHLVLRGDRIVVVDVKHFDGLIYGGEDLRQWTQVVNRKNFHFDNPLEQMQMRIQAVKSVVPDASVEGTVVFAGNSRFPKRIPEGVLRLDDIPRRRNHIEVPEQMHAVWNRLRHYRATISGR